MSFSHIKKGDDQICFFSQSGQDRFLHEKVFKGKRGGFFVEIGAYDGISFSNTYFFEKNYGWQGICIEPIAERFEQLKQNRACQCILGCISPNEGMKRFLHVMGGINYGVSEGENTEMLSGLLDAYHPKHRKIIDYELGIYGGEKHTLDMQCRDLSKILNDFNCKKIDLLSVDTEGNELEILEAIDYKDIDIDIIVVEALYPDIPMRPFMEKQGYSLINRCEYDDIYQKNK